MKQILFTDISRLHTFSGFAENEGRRPKVEHFGTIEKAAMLVEFDSKEIGRVSWTGTAKDAIKKRFRAKKVSLKGCEVLPAFTECHTHLLYGGNRKDEFERRNRGDSYLSIAEAGGGIRSTVKATAGLSNSKLESDLKARLLELVRQGVATVEIKTGYAASIKEEIRHLGVLLKLRSLAEKEAKWPRIVVTCLAAHSIPDGENENSWLEKVENELLPHLAKNRIRTDIFIEKRAFSLDRGKTFLERAKALGITFSVHADQLSRTGATVAGLELGAQSADHVIEISPNDRVRLAKSRTVAVLLPAADLYTRLPYPDARSLIDAGARVALATDHNPGSSPGLDLALVGVIARTTMRMTLPEVLSAYTLNAAHAIGLNEHGALNTLKRADFICLKKGCELTDLFYEIGPTRSHAAIGSVWRDGQQISRHAKD